jgi:hypothetical protein
MKHRNTAFHQRLKILPFQRCQAMHDRPKDDRRTRLVSCWDQFITMLFCQLSSIQSIRDLEFRLYKKVVCFKKLTILLVACCFSPHNYSLNLNFIPVIIPFLNPTPKSLRVEGAVSSTIPAMYDFDIPYDISERNRICRETPGLLMQNVTACPMEIFYTDTLPNNDWFGAVTSRLPGGWGHFPKVVIAGHGGRGFAAFIEPAHRTSYEIQQKTITSNHVAKLLEHILSLPKNYNGTVICASCFSGLPHGARRSLASALSQQLHKAGYTNLTVEGFVGNILPTLQPHQLVYVVNDEDVDFDSLPNIEDLFIRPDQINFISNATGYTQWIFDPELMQVIPAEHPSARRRFYNGTMTFESESFLLDDFRSNEPQQNEFRF